jgi:hypothetical protein
LFIPELVYFEPDALEYPKGQRIHAWALKQNLPIHQTTSYNRITNLPGGSELEKYRIAKRTLVVGIRKAKRKYKWGKYGQGKYVYPDEQANALRQFITEQIFEKFPHASIDYFT